MPILIAVLGFVLLFIWYNWGRRKAQTGLAHALDSFYYRLFNRQKCKWHTKGNSSGTLQEFQCATCGVSAYSQSGNGPRECKRSTVSRL